MTDNLILADGLTIGAELCNSPGVYVHEVSKLLKCDRERGHVGPHSVRLPSEWKGPLGNVRWNDEPTPGIWACNYRLEWETAR